MVPESPRVTAQSASGARRQGSRSPLRGRTGSDASKIDRKSPPDIHTLLRLASGARRLFWKSLRNTAAGRIATVSSAPKTRLVTLRDSDRPSPETRLAVGSRTLAAKSATVDIPRFSDGRTICASASHATGASLRFRHCGNVTNSTLPLKRR